MRKTRKNHWIALFCLVLFISALGCSSTPTRRSFGETVDDAVITNKLKVRFMKDKTVKAFKVDIDTWKGIVSLRGKVNSQKQINRAIELAEQQHGVREVKSYLILKDRPATARKSKKKRTEVVEVIEEEDLTVEKTDGDSKKVEEVVEETEEEFVDEDVPSVTP